MIDKWNSHDTGCFLRIIKFISELILYVILFFLVMFIFSCSPEEDNLYLPLDPEATMVFPSEQDENGYYHVDLDWNQEYYPYFSVDVVADKIENSIVSARFDTDTYWVLGDSIAFSIPLYSPYNGLENYQGTPIPVRDTIIYLNQFQGTILPIVQNDTRIYFNENDNNYTSRRVVGPFPPELVGDTISLYMKVMWEFDNTFIEKEGYIEKFIVE